MSAEVERNLLNHYQLTNLYPSEWPKRDDDSDGSEEEKPVRRNTSQRSNRASRRMSRFSGLDMRASYKSRLSDKDTGGGSGNIVQKDEPDPLGISPSVVSQLRARGLDVEDNLKLRNRFMLSSTTFSPSLFLSQVHQTASTQELLQGLDFLSKSIEKKSASLKVLVESNFERFVKAKATIDNVYTEMRTQGVQQQAPAPARNAHNRVSSRGTAHFRSSSNPFSPQGQRPVEDQKKTALTKESEYGVQGIKAPLIELAVKAEEVWGPALGGRDRGDDLKSTLVFVERNHDLFQLGGNVQSSIRKQDYEALVQEYQKAKQASQDAKHILERADNDPSSLAEAQIFKILATGKMWHDVESQIANFRKNALKQLANVEAHTENLSQDERRESHTELISVLLQLGTAENPIWLWLSSWYSRIKDKITKTFERARLDIEVLRRNLAARGQPSPHLIKTYLQSAASGLSDPQRSRLDSPQVIQFWELVEKTFDNLLSQKTGLLGEIADYWENARSFMDGRAQKDLPNSVWSTDESRQHLYMSGEHMKQLKVFTNELIRLLREAVYTLFLEPPIEDISDIFSPAPKTPAAQTPPITPADKLRVLGFDASELPPLTPNVGEAWERYAFWPPHANSLSGARYLSRILLIIGGSASDTSSISVIKDDPHGVENLRNMVGAVRERSIQAVAAAWNTDAESCKLLEDWSRSSDRKDLTNMPTRFLAFEESVVADLQKILYLAEAMSSSGSGDVLVPPPAKLLQVVRSQFVTSLYKALSGTVENAEKTKRWEQSQDSELDALTVPLNTELRTQESVGATGPVGRNVRMLLTLSNLKHMQRETIPQLINQFETQFSVQLTEESNTIRDVLTQIDGRLFQSYVKPTVEKLSKIVHDGITSPSWAPTVSRPTNARPYVYDVLLSLVLVHTEVSTSATTLTNAIISQLLEQVSLALLDSFQRRQSYPLSALMQATLDIEMTAQTLSNYTTDQAQQTQSQIYTVLDQRTDHAAREKLQSELQAMRASLKSLRESTKGQFGCFKRERRGRSDRPGT
ncbi:exocyst complex component SEC5 [Elsinoe australis]|uniref:Exocyst complex component SEC5 n=1 Tax=Elsinoe australis TaxID=40998 RepID=A0A4U7AZD2_9PEZI|nr:exocyst complex component SEC5 [Elsinoe australis]